MKTYAQISALAKAAEGVPIYGCLPGSVARLAGVKSGDIILEVNGQRVKTIGEYSDAQRVSAHMTFKVMRDAEVLEFSMDRKTNLSEEEFMEAATATSREFQPTNMDYDIPEA